MDAEQLKLTNQVCFPLYTVSRLITKAYKPFLDQLGITYPQYLVLMILWEKDGININEIGERLILNTNTLSPLLKRLEKQDLLERKRCTKDERRVFVYLTEKGKYLKTQALPIPEKLTQELVANNIELKDLAALKLILNDWISLLSDTSKK